VGPSCSNADLHMPIHINEKYYIIGICVVILYSLKWATFLSIGKILPKIENFKVFWKVFNSEKWEIKIQKIVASLYMGFQRCTQKYRRIIKYI